MKLKTMQVMSKEEQVAEEEKRGVKNRALPLFSFEAEGNITPQKLYDILQIKNALPEDHKVWATMDYEPEIVNGNRNPLRNRCSIAILSDEYEPLRENEILYGSEKHSKIVHKVCREDSS